MTVEEFINSPWQKASIHPLYGNSFLHMRPAPEYASGEVVLASTYRAVGFAGGIAAEGRVPANGRAFQKSLDRGKRPRSDAVGTGIPLEPWKRIVSGTLRSPKQPNQTAKRFLQIGPVVPDAALYSLSARLSSNSWNPGEFVARVLLFGEPDHASAQALWNRLFHCLDVDENDDLWARFLHDEFSSWRSAEQKDSWRQPNDLERDAAVMAWHQSSVPIPANQFVRDLDCILALKQRLTRRQWISMVEAMLRIGAAAHVLWTSRANSTAFGLLRNVLRSDQPLPIDSLRQAFGVGDGFWRYGQLAGGAVNDFAVNFIKARAGLNLFLHHATEKCGAIQGSLSGVKEFASLLQWTAENRSVLDYELFARQYERLMESDQRAFSGKKGIGANVREFLRHVLGQRQTAEPGLDSYDQGYFLGKRGNHRAAPWFVSLGPVAVLSLVHACTHNAKSLRTVDDLCLHLGRYGIDVQAQDVPHSRLGLTLRNLGLVVDSPDAEGGMVVLNPFVEVQEKLQS